jgi:hypothetical protein
MTKKRRLLFFLKSVLNLNWIRRPGIIECRSSRLRISLLKRIPSVNPVRNSSGALISTGIILRFSPASEQRDIISNGVNISGRRGEMTNESIILKLTPEEVLNLTRILLDEDKEEALLFLKQCLKPQIDRAGRGRLVRSFEAP